jgi:hypothetical protein
VQLTNDLQRRDEESVRAPSIFPGGTGEGSKEGAPKLGLDQATGVGSRPGKLVTAIPQNAELFSVPTPTILRYRCLPASKHLGCRYAKEPVVGRGELDVRRLVEWLAVALVLTLIALLIGLLICSVWPTFGRPRGHGDIPNPAPLRVATIKLGEKLGGEWTLRHSLR